MRLRRNGWVHAKAKEASFAACELSASAYRYLTYQRLRPTLVRLFSILRVTECLRVSVGNRDHECQQSFAMEPFSSARIEWTDSGSGREG